MIFSEDTRVKIPCILHLIRLGYQYLSLKNSSWDEETNIFPEIFRESIANINPDIEDAAVERLLADVKLTLDNEDLGRAFYEKLTERSGTKLIDFTDFTSNSFHVVTELTCKNGDDEFRPDITLLVNGMPLAFIEVKKPNNPEGILAERNRIITRCRNRRFRRFINIDVAECGQRALDLLSRHHYDAALLDIHLPDMNGMQLLGVLRERQPECLVLMMTGQAAVAAAVEAMKLGAYDYLAKPFRIDLLLIKLERLLQYRVFLQQKEAASESGQAVMIGRSASIARLLALVDNVAKTDATILLLGETGTGKGMLARLIHERSRRNLKPMVSVNCAAIPENLLEAELFGFEKGAFTGAHKQHPGLLEQAHESTLFLDEVGDIPPATQVKLLRALEERVVYRLGGAQAVSVDFRLLTATNRNLEQLRRDGTIREDFFYRLNVFPVTVPPLRDRLEDVPLLASHFLRRHAQRHQLPAATLAPETMERFCHYSWPGNVRELDNLLERLQVLYPGKIIQPQNLPPDWGNERASGSELLHGFRTDLSLRTAVQEFEARFIQRVLDEERGSRTRTAERLGISRKSLWEKLAGNGETVT